MKKFPIRVLHIVVDMNMGGIETMLINYHRKINRKIIQFDYLVHRQERAAYDDEIEKLGGKIYCLPKLNPLSLKYRQQLSKFFKSHTEYQIVHSHINCLSAIPLKYAKKHNVPNRISHSHANTKMKFTIKDIIKIYYRNKLTKYTTKQFACSKEAGTWLYKDSTYSIFPNAIDAKRFIYNPKERNKIRTQLKIKNELVIGNVSSFYYIKNHSFLIDIFNEIINKGIDSKLLLIGDGQDKNHIKNKVRELNLTDKVMFLGQRSDVNNILQAFDVFLLPSLYEGLGIACIEAQAAGLPCIISDSITKDCIITDKVYRCSLKKPASYWAQMIIDKSNVTRNNYYSLICKAGYDIVSCARDCERFYTELIK